MEVHDQQYSLEQTIIHQDLHQSTRTPSQSRCQVNEVYTSMSSAEPSAP